MLKKTLATALLIKSSFLFANEVDLEKFKNLSIIKQSNLNIVKAKDIGDNWFYLEALNRDSKMGIFTDMNKVIVGRGFYSQTGKEIKFDIDMEKYKKNALFTIGEGKNEYFLFTDPECPYCKMFDDKLQIKAAKENLKIYVYFTPLNFHLLGNAMSISVMSQPEKERSKYLADLMKKNQFEIIKETYKYTNIFYKDLEKALSHPQLKQVALRYIPEINKALATSIKDESELLALANKMASKGKKSDKEKLLNDTIELTKIDFPITGTPSLFDISGKKEQNPYQIFTKHGIVNLEAIEEIEKLGMTIQMGDSKKEKLYIFSSTKCPHCINSFQDKKMMEKLSKYNVHFILMNTGSNPKMAMLEAQHLFTIKNPKERFKKFSHIMNGGMVDIAELNKKPSASLENKLKLYSQYLNETMVNATPVIVNSKGRILNNVK